MDSGSTLQYKYISPSLFNESCQVIGLWSHITNHYNTCIRFISLLLQDLAAARGAKLAESNRLQEFFRELDDEDAWIKEKKILVTSDDFGKDLTGIQNLRKKHKRFEQELASKENTIQVGFSQQLRSLC